MTTVQNVPSSFAYPFSMMRQYLSMFHQNTSFKCFTIVTFSYSTALFSTVRTDNFLCEIYLIHSTVHR